MYKNFLCIYSECRNTKMILFEPIYYVPVNSFNQSHSHWVLYHQLYGIYLPVIIILTFICNILAILVQYHVAPSSQKIGIFISQSVTGVFQLPILIQYVSRTPLLEHYSLTTCGVSFVFGYVLPHTFHVTTIWQMMFFALQRFLSYSVPFRYLEKIQGKTILKATVILYSLSVLYGFCNFADIHLICHRNLTWNGNHNFSRESPRCGIYENFKLSGFSEFYQWCNVIFIHIFPCFHLFIFNILLIVVVIRKYLQRRRLFLGHKRGMRILIKDTAKEFIVIAYVTLTLAVEVPSGIVKVALFMCHTTNRNSEFLDAMVTEKVVMVTHVAIISSYLLYFFINLLLNYTYRQTFVEMLYKIKYVRIPTLS